MPKTKAEWEKDYQEKAKQFYQIIDNMRFSANGVLTKEAIDEYVKIVKSMEPILGSSSEIPFDQAKKDEVIKAFNELANLKNHVAAGENVKQEKVNGFFLRISVAKEFIEGIEPSGELTFDKIVKKRSEAVSKRDKFAQEIRFQLIGELPRIYEKEYEKKREAQKREILELEETHGNYDKRIEDKRKEFDKHKVTVETKLSKEVKEYLAQILEKEFGGLYGDALEEKLAEKGESLKEQIKEKLGEVPAKYGEKLEYEKRIEEESKWARERYFDLKIDEDRKKQESESKENLALVKENASLFSDFSRYEQNYKNTKQALLDICEEYEAYGADDENFLQMMEVVRAYGKMDASAKQNYNDEKKLLKKIDSAMTAYAKSFEKEFKSFISAREKLNAAMNKRTAEYTARIRSEKGLGKEDELKLTEEEQRALDDGIQREFGEQDRQLNAKEDSLNTKQMMVTSLQNYLTDMRSGDLECPYFDSEEIKPGYTEKRVVTDDNGNETDRYYCINGAGVDVNMVYDPENANHDPEVMLARNSKKTQRTEKELKEMAEQPLFPHEPRPNDIQQGYLGNCYMLAGLAAVARQRPQHIRDMIKDNHDGTVTVRFYHKEIGEGGKKEYIPLYVRVDKVPPEHNKGGENCLWVSAIERAYAVSGLHMTFWNTEKTKGFADKEKLDAEYEKAKADLTGMAAEEEKEDYIRDLKKRCPWLVRKNKLVPWQPCIEDISGGETGEMLTTCFGPLYEKHSYRLYNSDHETDDNKKVRYERPYNIIAENLSKHLPVIVSSRDNDTLANGENAMEDISEKDQIAIDRHAFEVIAAYETDDEPPTKMIRVRNPWGDTRASGSKNAVEYNAEGVGTEVYKEDGIYDIPYAKFLHEFDYIKYNGGEELSDIPCTENSEYDVSMEMPERQRDEVNKITQDVYMDYLKFARDIHTALVETGSSIFGNSRQYKELLAESIKFRQSVAASRNRDISSLAEPFRKLQEKSSAYKDHLGYFKTGRQKRRLKICQTIDRLGEQIGANSRTPLRTMQEDFAKEWVKAEYKARKLPLDEKNAADKEKLKRAVDTVLEKKVVQTVLKGMNVNQLNHPTDKMFASVRKDSKTVGKGLGSDKGFAVEDIMLEEYKKVPEAHHAKK